MNDTFLSIENATGVAGRGIRAGLCRFPPTGRGARLATRLWCRRKMTDASGNVCPLSPKVSVYSCLWMICPWWLSGAGSEFMWLHMKSSCCHTASPDNTPVRQSAITPPLPTNRQKWTVINCSIASHPYLSVSAICHLTTARGQLTHTFIWYWWNMFMPPDQLVLSFEKLLVLHKGLNVEETKSI